MHNKFLSCECLTVVLDEAQMVENKNSRPSQMTKKLPAVHRWGTTGNQRDLIYFLEILKTFHLYFQRDAN